MKRTFLFIMCALAGILAGAQYEVRVTPTVPLQTAVSGHYAGVTNGELRTWGGCNFPDVPLAEGGKKRFYPMAYGVSIPVSQGTVCVGGTADDVTSEAEVMMERNVTYRNNGISQWEFDHGTRAFLTSLPKGLHNLGGAYWDGYIYVLAGQSDSVPNHDVLRLEWPNGKVWEKVAEMPGDARLQPVVTVQHNPDGPALYVFGGFSPRKGTTKGYVHTDGLCMDLKSMKWKTLRWPGVPADALPTVGACIRAEGAATIQVIGGVNAEIFTDAINHPHLSDTDYLKHEPEWYKFQQNVLVYNTYTDSWTMVPGTSGLARAGATWTKLNGFWFVAGGELKPGIRTVDISCVELIPTHGFYEMGLLSMCVTAMCFIALVLVLQRKKDELYNENKITSCMSGLSVMCSGLFFWVVPTFFFIHAGLIPMLVVGCLYVTSIAPRIQKIVRLERGKNGWIDKTAAVCLLAAWLLLPSWLMARVTVWPMWMYALIMMAVAVPLYFCERGRRFVWADVVQQAFMLLAVMVVIVLTFTGVCSLPELSVIVGADGWQWLVFLFLIGLMDIFFSFRKLRKSIVNKRFVGGALVSLLLALVMSLAMFVCIRDNVIVPDYTLKSVYAVWPAFLAAMPYPWLSGFMMATLMSASWCAIIHQLRRLF